MKKPVTFEDACTLALRGHNDDLPLSEMKEAARMVAEFDASARLTPAQHGELGALMSGMLGAQFRHREHPLNAPGQEQDSAQHFLSTTTFLY